MADDKEFKKNLKGLIISSPKGLTVSQLLRDYRETIGREIPFRAMGYTSIVEYLQNIPDTLRLCGYGMNALVVPVADEKLAHLEEMVQKQRRSSRSGSNRRSYNHSRELMRPRAIRVKNEPTRPDPNLNSGTHDRYSPSNASSNPQTYSRPDSGFNSCTNARYAPSNASSNPQTYSKPGRSSYAPSHTSSNPSYAPSSRHIPLLNFTDSDNGFSEGDQRSPSPTLPTSHIAKLQKNNVKESIKITNTSFNEPASNSTTRSQANPLKEQLKLLIDDNPDGIWCSELPKIFKQKFKQDLAIQAKGYVSVLHFCSSYKDIFQFRQPDKGDFKVYDARKILPEKNIKYSPYDYYGTNGADNSTEKEALNALPDDLEQYNEPSSYNDEPPSDIVGFDKLPRQWLDIPDDHYITVRVTEIYDPTKFWIQLYSDDCSAALDDMMNELQNVYVNIDTSYNVPPSQVKVGLYVVASIYSEYHRGLVVKIDDNFCKVNFFDYGTIGKLSINALKYLHKDFATLPRQAIRARLANIRPRGPNLTWSVKATQYFLELVTNKILVAEIINPYMIQHRTLDIILTDTNDREVDIHINDMLKKHHHADLVKDASQVNSSISGTDTDLDLSDNASINLSISENFSSDSDDSCTEQPTKGELKELLNKNQYLIDHDAVDSVTKQYKNKPITDPKVAISIYKNLLKSKKT